MSRKMKWSVAVAVAGMLILLLALGGIAGADSPAARAILRDPSAHVVGVVQLDQDGDKVTVRAVVRNLSPGFHGFHIHETGMCEPTFGAAGGHFNPQGTSHGDHAGDMPSLLANEDGTAFLWFKTDRFTVDQLLDADGSAVIVHADPDNFANIPDRYHSHTEDVFGPDSATLATGDAGGRVACGVVES